MVQVTNPDLAIAMGVNPENIEEIANKLGLEENEWEPYGRKKAKVSLEVLEKRSHLKNAPIVLVTAINPTPAGEGKSTVTVGLAQAFNRIGQRAVVALREPSLGPTLGLKGGACGGGHSQVIPMDDINLHFTGDMHAITTAHNSLAAYIDNHLHQGNELALDPRRITWKRVLDMNDRALRTVTIGLGGPVHGVPRETGFDITVASEIMAILCLADSLADLKARLGAIEVGFTYSGARVVVDDLGVSGALTLLLKDAIRPNLVQTLEHTPAIIHGGPFANIAHGCNSVLATRMAQKLGDLVVTEAGFGADLGAEKFMHIKGMTCGLEPDAVVVVATIRALKMHGGVPRDALSASNPEAMLAGCANLAHHLANMAAFGVPTVVAINRFVNDSSEELDALMHWCQQHGHRYALADVWAKGGEGGIALAEAVQDAMRTEVTQFTPRYRLSDDVASKIEAVACNVYGAEGVTYAAGVAAKLDTIRNTDAAAFPVCMAKTPFSISDDPTAVGRPEAFQITVRDVRVNYGARFVVVYTGNVLTMPGLPKHPAMQNMDVNAEGVIEGLF
ncbi:MAG: formate--tetrahydrofolate ligase [Bacilli bacterium]